MREDGAINGSTGRKDGESEMGMNAGSLDAENVKECRSNGEERDRFPSQGALDEGPTDAEIDSAWADIQRQLYHREEERVTLTPQVYKFQPASPQKGEISSRGIEDPQTAHPAQYYNQGVCVCVQ